MNSKSFLERHRQLNTLIIFIMIDVRSNLKDYLVLKTKADQNNLLIVYQSRIFFIIKLENISFVGTNFCFAELLLKINEQLHWD